MAQSARNLQSISIAAPLLVATFVGHAYAQAQPSQESPALAPAPEASQSDTDAEAEATRSSLEESSSPRSPPVEEIVITGIRASLQSALDKKRNSSAIVDAISADDIDKFPDENIAESLQRIPGLSITRSFGEGQDVSIRGLGPGRNLTLLNGQGLASSSFFLEDFEFSRGFNFALLPSEVVSSVEVYKSPEARLQEGGIGGTIILNTRRPLDQDELVIAASIASGYGDLPDELDLRASGLFSWRNKSKTFGVLVSGVHQERTLRRDAIEVLFYDESDIDVDGDGTLEGTNVIYPGIIGSALFEQERVRTTGLATVQWNPVDSLDFTATGLVSRLGGDNTNHNYLSLQFLAPLTGADSVVNDAIIRNNTAVFLDLADGPAKEVELDSIRRETALMTYSADLLTQFRSGGWRMSNQTGYTRATGGRGDLLFTAFTADSSYRSDLRDGVGAVTYDTDPSQPASLTGFTRDSTFRDNISGTQEQFYSQLDAERYFDTFLLSSIQAGVKFRAQSQNRDRVVGTLRDEPGFDALDDIANLTTPSDFLDGIAGPDGLTRYAYPDIVALSGDLPISAYDFNEDPTFFFDVNERIIAAYTQLNLSADVGEVSIRGNVGLRYVNTRTVSRARRQEDDALVRFRDVNTYNEVLPSINVTVDLFDEVVVRVAGARVMNRPAFTQLSPAVDLNRTVFTGTGGNPQLNPFIANQADLSAEWYFDRGAVLSLALFYKDIESFVGLQENEEVFDGDTFRVTRPFNGEGGNIRGLEASIQYPLLFLPWHFDGLGFVVNYTLAGSTSSVEDPQTGESLPVPGLSEHTVNVIAYYEKGPFGIRVAYNYRTKFFEQIDRGGARFTDAFGQLDGGLSWNFWDGQVTLFAEALNLTNETLVRFVGSSERPFQNLTTGRRFFLGVRGHY